MSNLEGEHRTPLLEKFRAPPLLRRTFSRPWIGTIMVVSVQVFFCGLIWAFVGIMLVHKIISLPDNLAGWTYKNPSETNMLITVISTVLGMTGSFLLGITVQHALTFRLTRGIRLSIMAAWIQLARIALFLRLRRHLWWTLLSALWIGVIRFLTTAWSNLLTPEIVVQQFPVTGRELDFLNPAVSNYTYNFFELPPIYPTARSYSLNPESFQVGTATPSLGLYSQAGVSAAMVSFESKYPSFIGAFNSSTGGVNPVISNSSQLEWAELDDGLDENFKGLSTTYTFVQQGYTANVSCMVSSSPTIALKNTASAEKTFQTPSGSVNHTLQTWSWSTKCSADAEYYTGEVDLWARNDSPNGGFIGTGLLATSVCFYQDFSGPSNRSFLVLMQPTNSSGYAPFYSSGDNPNLPTICQVTPMVTTVEVQYNESGTINVNSVQEHAQLPNDSWPLVLLPGFSVWTAYLLAQGSYSNVLADDVITLANSVAYMNITPVLEQYLRGIIEYLGTNTRNGITFYLTKWGQPLPDNMTTPFSGTVNVQTMGWRFHPRTHGIALAVITLVTLVTTASGIFSLMEAIRPKPIRDPQQGSGSTATFDPTDLMDVLAASSIGNLANALSHCETEEDRENLRVKLGVTDEGQSVLNARADDADDAGDV